MIKGLLILFLFICGCSSQTSYQISEKQKIANTIRFQAAQELSDKYRLSPLGSGGQMMDEIKMLYLAFQCNRPLRLDEARVMIIGCVNTFVDAVNKNEKIRPYLANYPFNSKNIEVTIFIKEDTGKEVLKSELSIISIAQNCINYKICISDYECRTVFTETFEQAEKKLQKEAAQTK